MPIIKTKNEAEMIRIIIKVATSARELRFWDHYLQINKGEHGKQKRDYYLKETDNALKAMNLNNTQRLKTIKYIMQATEL